MTHLHLHAHIGSTLDGISTSAEYAEKAYSLKQKSLAITDHGKLSGWLEHQRACDKFGIKPILGVEAYITDNLITLNDKQKRERGANYHLVLLAKNQIGYKNLLKLNYISMADEDHFYYVNRITLEELFKNKEGLIITTGCMNSPINRRIINGKEKEANEIFDLLFKEFGENMVGEVQLNEFSKNNPSDNSQQKCNDFIIKKCKEKNIPIIIGGDVHYVEKGQDKLQTLSIIIRNKETVNTSTFELESKILYFHDIQDYINFNTDFNYEYSSADIIEWCHNTDKIAELCNARIPERTRMFLPRVSEDDDELLIRKSIDGLCRIFGVEKFSDVPRNYQARLKHELEIIIRKGFASYLLILEDIFREAEERGYYRGAGRGSAAGSLVVYALNITTLDPIKYDLLFERFMSEARTKDVVINFVEEE